MATRRSRAKSARAAEPVAAVEAAEAPSGIVPPAQALPAEEVESIPQIAAPGTQESREPVDGVAEVESYGGNVFECSLGDFVSKTRQGDDGVITGSAEEVEAHIADRHPA